MARRSSPTRRAVARARRLGWALRWPMPCWRAEPGPSWRPASNAIGCVSFCAFLPMRPMIENRFRCTMRVGACAIGLSTLASMAGCAHRPASQSEIDRLNRSTEALRLQNTAYAKQVEELENRVFILGDQLESRKVNEERAEVPRLPTVALHPAQAVDLPMPLAPSGTETTSEAEVEYAGEAAKSVAHRPVLRMRGDSAELT